ncbi:MAG TPA: hypothetical protein VFN11_13625, partial [Ktedonobacterales bacterium]|nr:hypothetical protein [Ktedonobacterales bacterium]
TKLPWLATVFMIVALSALGLPGLNSFAGEFLAFLGTFQSSVLFGVLGTLVVIPAAWYMLRFFQGTMEGLAPEGSPVVASRLVDLRAGEWLPLLPLLALIIVLGIVPNLLTQPMQQPVTEILGRVVPAATSTSTGDVPSRNAPAIITVTAETRQTYMLHTASSPASNEREQTRGGA